MTQPYQCRLDDGNLYAVKGRQATHRGLIAEVIAASLGQRIGLPIPEFSICEVSRVLSEHDSRSVALRALGTEPCFASSWVEPSEVFGLSMAKLVGDELLAQIYIFDHWIRNGDRTLTPRGGNVNLLMSLADDQLIAFDHNLAFSPSHDNDDLSLHVGRSAWSRAKNMPGFRDRFTTQGLKALADYDQIFDQLPEEWLVEIPDIKKEISIALDRISADAFWTELDK